MKLLVLAVLVGLSVARYARHGHEERVRETANPYTIDWVEIERCYGVTKEEVFQIEQRERFNEVSDAELNLYREILRNNLVCPEDGTVYPPMQVNWEKLEVCYGVTKEQISAITTKLDDGEDLTEEEIAILTGLRNNNMRCPPGEDDNDIAPENINWEMIAECYGRTPGQLMDIIDALDFGVEVSDEDENIIEELKKNKYQCPLEVLEHDKYSQIYWEKVDNDLFQQCTGMSKSGFYHEYYSIERNGPFIAQVLAGQCIGGYYSPLPKLPFMYLLDQMNINQEQFNDDLEEEWGDKKRFI